jgi:4-amino-4-deoxychorismate lyase
MDTKIFIETIRIIDGEFINLPAHIDRIKRTVREGYGKSILIPEFSNKLIPTQYRSGIVKCRILYSSHINSIHYSEYTIRKIETLRVVEAPNDIDYHLKYADRSQISALLEKRNGCDDIIIVRNGKVTDTSYSNIVLINDNNIITPSDYLLPGTMRQSLLINHNIQEQSIYVDDIKPGNKYGVTHIGLINAMMPLESMITIPVTSIIQ